jgi:hypothetical protein
MTSKFFKHRDGGLYQHVYSGKTTTDGSSVEIYHHLWPFEMGVWSRPSTEFWDGRFTEISYDVIADAKAGDRLAAQAAVNKAKADRKSV